MFESLPTPLCYIAGSPALIHNLKAQQYNGLWCIVKKYDRSRHCYLVQLQRDGKHLLLKANNLQLQVHNPALTRGDAVESAEKLLKNLKLEEKERVTAVSVHTRRHIMQLFCSHQFAWH